MKQCKPSILFLDYVRQIVTGNRCHVSEITIGAVVLAHARPFINPFEAASRTYVLVAKPSHWCLWLEMGPNTIVSARNELEIAVITKNLELLPNLLLNVSIVGIEDA